MRFLGKILDPKDVTTKEYVDNADDALKKELDNKKVDKEDITELTSEDVISLWNKIFNN